MGVDKGVSTSRFSHLLLQVRTQYFFSISPDPRHFGNPATRPLVPSTSRTSPVPCSSGIPPLSVSITKVNAKRRSIVCSHSRDKPSYRFTKTKDDFCIKKQSSAPRVLVWYTNMAASDFLVWNTSLTAVTSRETLYNVEFYGQKTNMLTCFKFCFVMVLGLPLLLTRKSNNWLAKSESP